MATDITDIVWALRKVDAIHEASEANDLLTGAADEIDRLRTDLAASNARVAELETQSTELRRMVSEDSALRTEDRHTILDVRRELAAANTRLTRQSALIEALDTALAESAKQHRMSMEQFKFYADQHMAKRPPDAEKALTNSNHAARCEMAADDVSVARATKVAMEGESDG